MKKCIILLFVSLMAFPSFSQDNGMTYQAVIYNPNGQTLPGEDDTLSPLVETDICLRFSIMGNGLEYEETVQTTTDMFGMVNLKIGSNIQTGGSATSIGDVDWDSGEKSMRVELNAVGNCSSFVQISYQTFSYVPFAYYAQNDSNEAILEDLQNQITENNTISETSDEDLLSAINAVQLNVDQNEQDSDDADASLQETIAGEVERATAAEIANSEAIAAEVERATAAEIANSEAIAAEVERATAAEIANSEAIAAEVERATAAEIANSEAIAAVIEGTGLSDDGSYTANTETNYISQSTSVVVATEDLDNAITTLQEIVDTLTERVEALELLHIPEIFLIGDAQISINMSSGDYDDDGATAEDLDDGDLTESIELVNDVDVSAPGTYSVTYNVTDSDGNDAEEVVRIVTVADDIAPVIILIGEAEVTIDNGSEYTDAGASATDNVDGDISSSIVVTGSVDTSTAGTYTITYNVSDSSGNAAVTVTRTVIVDSSLDVGVGNTDTSGSDFTDTQIIADFADFIVQNFKATESGLITGISVMVKQPNLDPTMDSPFSNSGINLRLYSGHQPGQTSQIGNSESGYPPLGLTTSEFEWKTFELVEPVAVEADGFYSFRINGPGMCNLGEAPIYVALNQSYEDGEIFHDGGCSGGIISNDYDLIFGVIIE